MMRNIVEIRSEAPAGESGVDASGENPSLSERDKDSLSESINYGSLINSTMEYDENSRLVRYNGEVVKYDKDGNMVCGPLEGKMAAFTYDCRNRLIEVKNSDGKVTRYLYDAENHRIGIIKNAGSESEVTIKYVVDTASGDLSQVLSEKRIYYQKEEDEAETIYYFYGDNKLVSQVSVGDSDNTELDGQSADDGSRTLDNEGTSDQKDSSDQKDTSEYLIYHFNHIGSTTALTSLDGEVVNRFEYSAYGDLLTGSYDGMELGSYGDASFLYNGQYGVMSDDNGLYYMRARYYNIDIKRFINQDVVIGSIASSSSLNRYAYVEGNPVNYLDPFGLNKKRVDTTELHKAIRQATLVAIGATVFAVIVSSGTATASALYAFTTVSNILAIFDSLVYLYDLFTAQNKYDREQALAGMVVNVIGLGLTSVISMVTNITSVFAKEELEVINAVLSFDYTAASSATANYLDEMGY